VVFVFFFGFVEGVVCVVFVFVGFFISGVHYC